MRGRRARAREGNSRFAALQYDALGRVVSEESPGGGVKTMEYDLAGRRKRLTWADGFFVTYEHYTTGEMTAIREQGNALLASFAYDALGRRTALIRGNNTSTSYGYDAASRLQSQSLDLGGAGNDLTLTFAYNPASQIVTRTGRQPSFRPQLRVSRKRLAKWASIARRMPSAIWAWPSGEWM